MFYALKKKTEYSLKNKILQNIFRYIGERENFFVDLSEFRSIYSRKKVYWTWTIFCQKTEGEYQRRVYKGEKLRSEVLTFEGFVSF